MISVPFPITPSLNFFFLFLAYLKDIDYLCNQVLAMGLSGCGSSAFYNNKTPITCNITDPNEESQTIYRHISCIKDLAL